MKYTNSLKTTKHQNSPRMKKIVWYVYNQVELVVTNHLQKKFLGTGGSIEKILPNI